MKTTIEQDSIKNTHTDKQIFSGKVYLIYAFDIGDEIAIDMVRASSRLHIVPRSWPDYLKSYHKPLTVCLTPQEETYLYRANLHHFGGLSLVYQVPFEGTLHSLRNKLSDLDFQLRKQSTIDAHTLFKKIEAHVSQPKFFHQRDSYMVLAIEPTAEVSATQLRDRYGALIVSALRFEKTSISQFQMEDILESATGYYREDLVIIDTEAAFVYDRSAQDLLDFFELTTIQRLELRYFSSVLDRKLDDVYNKKLQKPSFKNYMPFVGIMYDPVSELSKLKVDISVITERLGNSIKTVGDVYYSEIYDLLVNKLELDTLRSAIEKKLSIIQEVRTIYQNQISSIREDLLEVLIIILIFTELVVAIIK